jgi:Fe-S-cluster-containing dehydrogenase component/formate-dependent nitrite reductase membrane component NrfD
MEVDVALPVPAPARWAKVIDNSRCIGCHACTVACKSENEVPVAVTRTYVKYVEQGFFPNARRAFQVTRCNMCEDAPCVTACPTSAMFRRPDGIVDFDKSACIGCKACIAACPYDAIFINPTDHSAEKCNFCAHRLDVGLEPACVVVCPTEAILVGDMNDPSSRVAQIVGREAVTVRRPEKASRPKLFYRDGSQSTLDPLAARRPDGGLFMWSEQGTEGPTVVSGSPRSWNNSASALLAYDVSQHTRPWDWRVSLYTWTKSVSAGVYLVAALLVLFGYLSPESPLWLWAAPVLGGVFLAATGAILIGDLEHPNRFFLIFIRPQWRSWLVRGAVIITAYVIALSAHFSLALIGFRDALSSFAIPGIVLALLTATYTAYLFAQARARDLWQNPLLPAHLFIQAVLAGTAVLAVVATFVSRDVMPLLLRLTAVTSAVHLLLIASEFTLTPVTAHARLAHHELVRGTYARYFWGGVVLAALGVVAPALGLWGAAAALGGLLSYEHAYVQAGQFVPLA